MLASNDLFGVAHCAWVFNERLWLNRAVRSRHPDSGYLGYYGQPSDITLTAAREPHRSSVLAVRVPKWLEPTEPTVMQ